MGLESDGALFMNVVVTAVVVRDVRLGEMRDVTMTGNLLGE